MTRTRNGAAVILLIVAASIGFGATLAGSQPSDSPPSKADLVTVDPFAESARHDAVLLQAELDRRLEVWSAATLPP